MKSAKGRRVIAEFAIGLMICGAVHVFLIAPAEEKVRRIQEEADAITGPRTVGPTLSSEQIGQMSERARAAAEAVERMSKPAKDETELFSRIMSLADEAGVRVDQLQPIGSRAVVVKPPGTPVAEAAAETPDAAAPPGPADVAVGYGIIITARYAQVVEFVRKLPSDVGLTVVRSIRIEPADSGDPEAVRAHVETEHFAFDVSGVRALLSAQPTDATGRPE